MSGLGRGEALIGKPDPPDGVATWVATLAPSVRITADRRPEAATQVSLASFDGPFGLLLSLIEARRLDVMTVPLGALTEAYLDALAALTVDRIGNISAFVAVASQLILIKSRALLPRPPQELPSRPDEGADPEEELRARLLLYRAYRDAGATLGALLDNGRRLVRREPAASVASGLAGAAATPGPPLDPAILAGSLERLLRVAPPPELPPEVLARMMTLAERADAIRQALEGAGSVVLQVLLRGVRDRVVVAVTFLAMLELVKRREVTLEQEVPWGPILIRQVAGAPGSAAEGGRHSESSA